MSGARHTSLRRPLLMLAALLAATVIAIALLRETPRQPVATLAVQHGEAHDAGAVDTPADRRPAAPSPTDPEDDEIDAAAERAAGAMVVRYIASGLMLESSGFFTAPELARRAFGGELAAVADELRAQGESGDRQADVALLALDDYLCVHMRRVASADTLHERMRISHERARSDAPLSANEERYFGDVFAAEIRIIDELHARCAGLEATVAQTQSRLQGALREGDPDALVYLTHAGLADRDLLWPALGDLPSRLLPAAVDTLLNEHSPDLCASKDLLLQTILVRGFDSAALASATADVLELDCEEAPANAALAMPFRRTAALGGDLQSLEDYSDSYAADHPDDGRIERFAWRLYRQRLNGYGCLGSGYLYYLRDTLSNPVEQGLNLSPYEYAAAIERADEMWARHGAEARQRLGCAAPAPREPGAG